MLWIRKGAGRIQEKVTWYAVDQWQAENGFAVSARQGGRPPLVNQLESVKTRQVDLNWVVATAYDWVKKT